MKALEKESFLNKYKLTECYDEKCISWDVLQKIYNDYISFQDEDAIKDLQRELWELLTKELKGLCHSVETRMKDPEHLIEKIIRKKCIEGSYKYENIGEDNYREIVRDLIGVRVLVLVKEGWEVVHDKLCDIFKEDALARDSSSCYMKEAPEAYIRYGDRDVFHNKIRTQYSNKGYRSQHYVVSYKGCYCEIQVRTIAEEVYGEFDHKVRYPYRKNNKFLLRYTTTMAQIIAVADELVSTCIQMPTELWDECAKVYGEDSYIDWNQRNKPGTNAGDGIVGKEVTCTRFSDDAREIANDIILRRKGD